MPEISPNNTDVTNHKIFYKSSQSMKEIKDESVSLIVTSPPYPMIEMWDEIFASQNPEIRDSLQNNDGKKAFNLMHDILDNNWEECYRVLIEGGIACINIGDATRTLDKNFQLYPSHARIIQSCHNIGFQSLPEILWRKQTNAPNKFMGSGMLPPGAYVTLEHEYILIFRKGKKREFKEKDEKLCRHHSSYFWEERNKWFSDIWDFKGINQSINGKSRNRSGAFPFEVAYRLINMFTVKNDIVVDPFSGTGTTTCAAIVAQRNSIGYEIDKKLKNMIENRFHSIVDIGNFTIQTRLLNHRKYMERREAKKGPAKYSNINHNFPVITNQEKKINLQCIKNIDKCEKLEKLFNCIQKSSQIKSSDFKATYIGRSNCA